jgi:hypothetical protein
MTELTDIKIDERYVMACDIKQMFLQCQMTYLEDQIRFHEEQLVYYLNKLKEIVEPV